MNNKHILNGITYRAKVVDFIPGYTLYNFGTETFIGQRVNQHKRVLNKDNINYEIISEKQDRQFNNKTIKSTADSLYINKLKEILINKSNNNTIKTLVECTRISAEGLSSTECLIIPNNIFNSDLFEESIKEVDEWYYTDKSIRIPNKYSNASNKNFKDLNDKEKKNACRPFIYPYHTKILNFIEKMSSEERENIKTVSIQSLSLAYDYRLFKLLPNLNKIEVLVVADDEENNKDIYNKMCEDKLYNIVDLNSDAEVEDYYMNECKGVDLVIGNPPYNNTLHATILNAVVENNPNASIIWLAPDNLINGKQSPCVKVRDALKDRFNAWEHIGNQFGEIKIATPISIYYFTYKGSLNWENIDIKLNEEDLPSYKSILQKIKDAPKINRVNKEEKKCDFRKGNGGSKQVCWNNLLKFFPGGVIPKTGFLIRDNGGLFCTNSLFAQNGKLSSDNNYQNGWYCVFNSEKECKEQMDKLNDPRYRWILKVLSPNNRSLLCRPEELPESFDACNFTEEEIKELKDYYEKKN